MNGHLTPEPASTRRAAVPIAVGADIAVRAGGGRSRLGRDEEAVLGLDDRLIAALAQLVRDAWVRDHAGAVIEETDGDGPAD